MLPCRFHGVYYENEHFLLLLRVVGTPFEPVFGYAAQGAWECALGVERACLI